MKLERSRNCEGDQPARPVLSVRLPSDQPGTPPDLWTRCPWKEIDRDALTMIRKYLDAKDDGIPIVATAEDMHINLVTLSRIIRAEMTHAIDRRQTTAGEAAAEAQRKVREAELLGKGSAGRYPRGSRRAAQR